jgi:hypothetical protein
VHAFLIEPLEQLIAAEGLQAQFVGKFLQLVFRQGLQVYFFVYICFCSHNFKDTNPKAGLLTNQI